MVVKLDKVFHKGIMSRREVDIKNLKRCASSKVWTYITHLIYADSLILFCKVKSSVMDTLINRMDTYYRCFKLSINKNRGLFVLGYLEPGCLLCSGY